MLSLRACLGFESYESQYNVLQDQISVYFVPYKCSTQKT